MSASDNNPMQRIRALGQRLEEAAEQLGLTMENFSVIPSEVGEHGTPVDLCQAVFSVTADNVVEDLTPPDVELAPDEREAFASLESLFNETPSTEGGVSKPSIEEMRDFLGDD